MERPEQVSLWRLPRPLSAKGKRWYDVVLATVLVALSAGHYSQPLQLALSVGLLVPLFWRRTRPLPSSVVVLAVSLLQVLLVDTPIWGQVGLPITMYSVARFGPVWWAWCSLALSIAGAALGALDWISGYTELSGVDFSFTQWLAYFVTNSLIAASGWMMGALNRTRAAYVDALEERSRRVQYEAEQRAELAAMDERTRIAREMHDVVAHGLSVMIVQADGARYAAAANPDAVGPALETIAATGRESLTEMRQLLGLLREDAEAGTRPLPGLPEIPWLLAQAEASGTPITADLADPLPNVSGTVGLACYRLVQEALTNVRKHAGPSAQAAVRLAVEGATLRLELTDTGRGAAAAGHGDGDGQGNGLIGMRERIHAVGGELVARPRRGGGFEVSARIPLGDPVL